MGVKTSAVKKSAATSVSACAAMKSAQVTFGWLPGAGGRP